MSVMKNKYMDNLTKEFGSWIGTEPRIIAEKQREKDVFNSVAGKKVKIQFTQQRDWSRSKGEAIGKIIPKDGGFMFLPARNRTRGYWLTLGLHNGFFATKTVNKIEII